MPYKADKLLEEALKNSASQIAEARIRRADQGKEWIKGVRLSKKDKQRWVASAYLPDLIVKLEKLRDQMREYIQEHGKKWGT